MLRACLEVLSEALKEAVFEALKGALCEALKGAVFEALKGALFEASLWLSVDSVDLCLSLSDGNPCPQRSFVLSSDCTVRGRAPRSLTCWPEGENRRTPRRSPSQITRGRFANGPGKQIKLSYF